METEVVRPKYINVKEANLVKHPNFIIKVS